ncbi:LOW QUALITY PROTEIN: mucin-15 [Geothlypis trichas]
MAPSHSTVTHITPGALAPSDNSSVKPTTLFPISVIRTSPMVKQDSPTPNFNPIQQTTKLNPNSSNPPTASPKDANEGAILGSVLIGLVGYFICATKRPESFSHRKFLFPTEISMLTQGVTQSQRCLTADKTEEDNAGCPSDGIPMDDITPSHPSLQCLLQIIFLPVIYTPSFFPKQPGHCYHTAITLQTVS